MALDLAFFNTFDQIRFDLLHLIVKYVSCLSDRCVNGSFHHCLCPLVVVESLLHSFLNIFF